MQPKPEEDQEERIGTIGFAQQNILYMKEVFLSPQLNIGAFWCQDGCHRTIPVLELKVFRIKKRLHLVCPYCDTKLGASQQYNARHIKILLLNILEIIYSDLKNGKVIHADHLGYAPQQQMDDIIRCPYCKKNFMTVEDFIRHLV